MTDYDDSEHDGTTEAHERRITRCRHCRARIGFLPTVADKLMPIEADSVEPADTMYDGERHESHFATCPGANKARRR